MLLGLIRSIDRNYGSIGSDERQTMQRRSSLFVLILTLMVPLLASSLGSGRVAHAADDDRVYLVCGSQSKQNCNVFEQSSDRRDFATIKDSTNPVACEGGIVWVSQTTRIEAQLTRNSRSAADPTFSGQVIEFTGDMSQDDTNVEAAVSSLHDAYVSSQPQASAARATDCQQGNTDQFKRKTGTFRSNQADTDIKVRVWYARETCELWNVYKVESKLMDTPNREVRAYSEWYTDLWWGGNDFHGTEKLLGCPTLSKRDWVENNPSWLIQARGMFRYYVMADSDIFFDPGCWYNGGKETMSSWFKLNGGTR